MEFGSMKRKKLQALCKKRGVPANLTNIRMVDRLFSILKVPKQMKPHIYMYYQLTNLYHNHRRYVKSRSDKQLRSKNKEGTTSTCDPEAVAANKQPIVPCGLIAWSLFNNAYRFSVDSKAIEVNNKDISWKSDREHKFGSDVYPKELPERSLIGSAKLNETVPLSQQEDLIVWMRTAALPTFRKLYGRTEVDLEANERITVIIENNYNTYNFRGEKSLVLSTTTWVGGKNEFLGAAVIVPHHKLHTGLSSQTQRQSLRRPIGDPPYLSWNKSPADDKVE